MAKDFVDVLLTPLKGLSLFNDSHRLKAGDLVTATNILCNPDGSFERVDCYVDFLTSTLGTGYALSIYEFERWDGTRDIIFFYDTTLYKLDNVGTTATALITGLSANKKIGYAAYNDYLYFGNKFDANRVLCPTFTHKIARAAVSTANATDKATTITLYNALATDYATHLASTTQHNQADTTNTLSDPSLAGGDAQATVDAACNDLKAKLNAHRSQASVHPTADAYHLVEAADGTSEATSATLITQIKVCYNQHIGDSNVALMNITGPSTAPTTVDSGAGSGAIGTFPHVYTFYDTINGVESAPSPASTSLSNPHDHYMTISAMAISTNPNVTHKRIYRTVTGGATYYRVATITNVTTTYNDTTLDAALGAECGTVGAGVIPATDKFLMYNDRMYMAGDISASYRMYHSEQYYPWLYLPATNFFDYDVEVTALAKVPNGVLTFEENKFWLNAGSVPSNFSRILVSPIVGCTNNDGFCYRGDSVIFISRYGLFYTDGGAFDNLKNLMSDDINTQLLAKNIDSASVVYNAAREEIRLIVASA